MNAKNLSLKFAFLALVVAVCLWSLFLGNGLKQGIDLRGGHSIVFEIYTGTEKVEALEARQKELQEQLKQASDPTGKKELTEELRLLAEELAEAKRSAASSGNVTDEMIRTLKERVDPNGLRMLEWRPRGANRFEVRMPAGKVETQRAQALFRQAIEDLERANVQRSDLRRVERSQKRGAFIDRLAGDDLELKRLLQRLADAYDRKQKTGSQDDISAWEAAQDRILERNVRTQVLRSIVNGYVTPARLEKLKGKPKALRKAKAEKKDYTDRIEKFRTRHKPNPSQLAGVDKAIACYQKWADIRRELEDPADLIRLITKAGVLEFRIAPYAPGARAERDVTRLGKTDVDRYVKTLRNTLDKEGPEGLARRADPYLWFPVRERRGYGGLVTSPYAGREYILLHNTKGKSILQRRGRGAWKLDNAFLGSDRRGLPAVDFQMDEAGGRYMDALTSGHVRYCMAILLDNEVYSAPVIRSAISRRGQITMGDPDQEEVNDLIKILRAGSLPARLNRTPVAQSTFGPTFGEANREMGKRAAIWALLAVGAFMFAYYLLSGFIADLALLLNLVLVLGAMSLLGAVFTLPGIAGVILTIGIAVDANVLIFERLREEQTRGQSVRLTFQNAYQRAFSAIFDANITTLLTCLILGWVGTPEVRGFAITLAFGVIFSMFSSLVVTRWMFQLLLDWKVITRPVFMLHIIGVPKINWMSKRHFFWVLSTAMVVMGVASLVWQGSDVLGIEFSAGTQAVITLKDDALIDGQLPTAELVRRKFLGQAGRRRETEPDKYGKLVDTARVEARINHSKVEQFLNVYDIGDSGGPGAGDDKVSLAEWKRAGRNEQFFRLLDADGSGLLDVDELRKLPEASYQVTTTETRVPLIREVARDAIGVALKRRTSCSAELVRDQAVGELGVVVNAEGYALVEPDSKSPLADVMENYAGGVVFVFRNVSPVITVGDFRARIRDMQDQPDFASKTRNPIEVAGLTPAENGYSAFAVFARSVEAGALARAALTEALAKSSLELVTEALARERAMVVLNFDLANAEETVRMAIVAVVLSWVAIVIYLWVRFGSIRWGLAAVVCLVHDVIIVVGLLAASGWIHDTALGKALGIGSFKIDLPMVAAILTVIGYSVNDTIVVFDRVRENRGKLATVSPRALNASVNQTLGRTLLTSTTTLLVVMIMYVVGGEAIRPFSFALLGGVLFGTYSSVAIASPLLMGFRKALVGRTTGAAAEEGI